MKMISLKLTPAEKKKKEMAPSLAESSRDEYPYWSRMTITGEPLEKLTALDDIKVGALVRVTALAKVKEVVMVDVEKGARDLGTPGRRVELQFQEMAVEQADDVEAAEGFDEAADED
jgi:hypothetical protein